MGTFRINNLKFVVRKFNYVVALNEVLKFTQFKFENYLKIYEFKSCYILKLQML